MISTLPGLAGLATQQMASQKRLEELSQHLRPGQWYSGPSTQSTYEELVRQEREAREAEARTRRVQEAIGPHGTVFRGERLVTPSEISEEEACLPPECKTFRQELQSETRDWLEGVI